MLRIIQMRVQDRSEKRIWLVIFLSYLKKQPTKKDKVEALYAVIVDAHCPFFKANAPP